MKRSITATLLCLASVLAAAQQAAPAEPRTAPAATQRPIPPAPVPPGVIPPAAVPPGATPPAAEAEADQNTTLPPPSSAAQQVYSKAQADLLQIRMLLKSGRSQSTVGSGFLV